MVLFFYVYCFVRRNFGYFLCLIVFFANDFDDYQQLKVFNHENIRYGCQRCKKLYQQKKTLGRHLRFDCGQKPAFTCQLCSKQYKHGYILLKHMRNSHDIHIQKLRQRSAPSPPKTINLTAEIVGDKIVLKE